MRPLLIFELHYHLTCEYMHIPTKLWDAYLDQPRALLVPVSPKIQSKEELTLVRTFLIFKLIFGPRQMEVYDTSMYT